MDPVATSEKPIANGTSKRPASPPPPPSPPLSLSTTEIALLAVYPSTLVLASAFYLLSPSPASQSSYFSQKHNIFNTLFVKYGWLWTSAAFGAHVSRLTSSSRPKALLRYAAATAWWIIVTQWFFGAPLMDRTFLWTGGSCQKLAVEGGDMGHLKLVATSAACRVAGGKWSGGHDLSGHVFLLVHASLFLWWEILPSLRAGRRGGWESASVYGVLGLWWWMLLMTGVYFHTWIEKVTGLVVAVVEWGFLYGFALRAIPEVRAAFGIPGI